MSLPAEYLRITGRATPRPKTWDSIIGNARAIERIREAIFASKKAGRQMPHILLFGLPGTGKSTIAQMIARDMGGELIETMGSSLETPQDVVRFLWAINAAREKTNTAPVWLIDEIHMLGVARGRQAIDQESLYPLLEDWRFPHNLVGKEVQDLDGQTWIMKGTTVPVWPFTAVGATTEPGALSLPLLRRFLLKVQLDPYTEAEIATITLGSAERLGWSIDAEAAALISRYARLNPGRSYELLTAAQMRAEATDRPITTTVVSEVVTREGLFPLGLMETDVKILMLLAERMPKGIGQFELCRAAGISPSQFSTMVEPYLRQLGFIETLARRVIRWEGLAYLASIGKADTSRVEVRAAMEKAAR